MSNTTDLIEIIKQLAEEHETFTSDDIRPLLPSGVRATEIPAAVAKARRDGLIEEVDRVKSTIPERKGSLVPVFRRPGSALALAVRNGSGEGPGPGGSALGDTAAQVVALKEHLNARGYICGVEEVATYLLMLASSSWVILAGPSGTGKSSLVSHVAELLGGVFHDVQVKPNWVSSEDSLGYYSEISKDFVPGVVTEALSAASRDSARLHFVRFDEMNLASPEYYLAELLSAGESWSSNASGGKRSNAIQLPPMPRGVERPDVYLSDNVFLVGTVNVDETTRSLSPKVLDRSLVLPLHFVDFSTVPGSESPIAQPSTFDAVLALLTDRPRSLASLAPDPRHVEEVAQVFSGLNDAAFGLGGPIGYRQRDMVVTMLELASRYELHEVLSLDTVLDIGILGSVLPKWQGSSAAAAGALRQALGLLLDVSLADDAPYEVLATHAAKSRFPRSAGKLIEMMKQFSKLGYFSAW